MKQAASKLIIKSFHITDVQMGAKTSLKDGLLTIAQDALQVNLFSDYIHKAEVKIIQPHDHQQYVNTIIDVVPISTKVLGKIGTGITHTLTGVCVLLTGCDTAGRQLSGFGSSEGILKEKMVFGMAGSPKQDEFMIHIDVMIKHDIHFNRQVAFSVYQLSDAVIQSIREVLKMKNGADADERYEYIDPPAMTEGKKKVAIVKQVAGQGAMYDNLLFPNEPSGVAGGISIIDMNNMPVMLTPNEYRDGALRSLT